MRISLIINSSACDPLVNSRKNLYRSAGYGERYRLLKEKVLPAALTQGFDEILVAGVFEEGEGYTYIPVEPRYRDRRDALWQREMGARYATGDILVFSHDDHMLAEDFGYRLRCWLGFIEQISARDWEIKPAWDLLIPKRLHGVTGVEMNNGRDKDYMGGHALVMKRWLWARVPWTSVDSEWWDCSLSRMWRQAGGKLVFADDLIHIDVEATEAET